MARPRARPQHREASTRSGTVPTYAESRSAPSAQRLTESLRARGAQWLPEFSPAAAPLTMLLGRGPVRVRAISPLDSPRPPWKPSAIARSPPGLRAAAATRLAHHHSFLAASKTVAPA